MSVPPRSAATLALGFKKVGVQMEEGGEGDLVLPAQGILWMQLHWYKIPLNRGNGAHFRGTNLVNATKHCQNAQHEDILWCLRRLQQPESGGLAQYRRNMGGVTQEDCHDPKITSEILCIWKSAPMKCCRTLRKWHKKSNSYLLRRGFKSFQILELCLLPLPGAKLIFTSPIKNC